MAGGKHAGRDALIVNTLALALKLMREYTTGSSTQGTQSKCEVYALERVKSWVPNEGTCKFVGTSLSNALRTASLQPEDTFSETAAATV